MLNTRFRTALIVAVLVGAAALVACKPGAGGGAVGIQPGASSGPSTSADHHDGHAPSSAPPSPGGAPAAGGETGCDLLVKAAFCATFDKPFGGNPHGNGVGRTGALNPEQWSVGHFGVNNIGQGQHNNWKPTKAMFCREPIENLLPPRDYFFCDGKGTESMHFMEAFDDAGGYLYNDAMVLQPVDFANRTASITFDVDAKVNFKAHTWWVSMWVSDEPVTGPNSHFGGFAQGRNAIGLLFDVGCASKGQPGSKMLNVELVTNFKAERRTAQQVGRDEGCFRTMDDMRNRFTVKLSQQRVEVFATDHDGTDNRLVARLDNLRLPFSRGFVHLQHAHYNAAKDGSVPYQTYHWDNVGFDGPVLPALRSYQVPHALKKRAADNTLNLGYDTYKNPTFAVNGVDLGGATRAFLSLSAYCDDYDDGCDTLQFRFNNGPTRTYRLPAERVRAGVSNHVIPLTLADLRAGSNTFQIVGFPGVAANINVYVDTA